MKLSARNQLSGTVTSRQRGRRDRQRRGRRQRPAARRVDHRRGRAGARPRRGQGGHGDHQGVGRSDYLRPAAELGRTEPAGAYACVAPLHGGSPALSGASDERLVELARAGDERAFSAIVERYRAPLLRYCQGYLPPAAAEDAVQQAFINAYRALTREAGTPPDVLRPWLYRVARNAALNVARDPHAGLDELPESLDGVRRPDEVVQARERFERVVDAVSALPPKQRQVIVRHALDGDSHERIATDLGMTAGSIRQLAHRARQTVRAAAAALVPSPLLRFLPVGADAAEVGSGAAMAKVAVAVVVVGAAGGGAVQITRHDEKPAVAQVRKAPAKRAAPEPPPAARAGGARAGGRRRRGAERVVRRVVERVFARERVGRQGLLRQGLLRARHVGARLVGLWLVRLGLVGLRLVRLRLVRVGLVRVGLLRLRHRLGPARPGPAPPGPARPARRAPLAPARSGSGSSGSGSSGSGSSGSGSSGSGSSGLGLLRLGQLRLGGIVRLGSGSGTTSSGSSGSDDSSGSGSSGSGSDDD